MDVKTYEIPEDINTLAVTAAKFPDGVKDAYEKLAASVPDFHSRQMYGVAEQVNGGLLYRACVKDDKTEEAGKYQVDGYTIPKGSYLFLTLLDWEEHMDLFGEYFNQLLAHPECKKDSIGVEIYVSSREVLLLVQKK